MMDGDRAGLSIFESAVSQVGVLQKDGRRSLYFSSGGVDTMGPSLGERSLIQLRARVLINTVTYLYSTDGGVSFQPLGKQVELQFSWWKGARPALFAYNNLAASKGHADFDWLHYLPLSPQGEAKPRS
jgi:hypothetical protein